MGFCDKRRAGVLMHISSLPSPYGTGVFGKTAVDFARFLADCGFSSAEEEFRHVIRRNFHIPPAPITWLADKFSRRFAGFGFRDVSTLTEVPKIKIPVLFVHGEKDTFVPTENTRQNYRVCQAPKRMVIVPNAAHGTSYLVERETCTEEILRFIAHIDDPENYPFGD